MRHLSKLLTGVPPSPTVTLSDKAGRLRAEGRDVINLAAGEPDFDTPRHIVEAALRALSCGDTHYAPARGKRALVEAIAAKLERENSITVAPNQVIVTPGGKWALYLAVAAIANPGDEILLLDPSWVSYDPIAVLHRAIPVHVPLPSADNFRVNEELLDEFVSTRTKALIVNTPNNPTGRVLSEEEISAIARFATKHDLYVVSDEIYEHIVYDGAKHRSLTTHPDLAGRTIIANSFSKGYAMTGWRLGWLAAPEPVAELALKLQTQSVTTASSFVMAGGVAALNGPQSSVAEMGAAYARRRRFMLDVLNDIPGMECAPIEGAFYLFPRFLASEKNSLQLADALLDRADIAATPGIAFGEAGECHLRLSIATSMDDLERAAKRLQDVVPMLS